MSGLYQRRQMWIEAILFRLDRTALPRERTSAEARVRAQRINHRIVDSSNLRRLFEPLELTPDLLHGG